MTILKKAHLFSLTAALYAGLLTQCSKEDEGSSVSAVRENLSYYQNRVATSDLAPVPVDYKQSPDFLDVRGVGDSGVNLSNLSKTAGYWKADLSFMNFESVVSNGCVQRNTGVDFFFNSSKSEVERAHTHGFNLFSVANNHARDCFQPYGPSVTAQSMDELASRLPLSWHGTADDNGNPYEARVKSFSIKGRDVKVAFAAISIQSWSMPGTAQIVYSSENANKPQINNLLKSLQQADANFRILSIHTQDRSGNNRTSLSHPKASRRQIYYLL
ncbi:MAG: CapA family protein [Pseudobacteriovorax sp.]|nr:CapA family protein [Pseudobacteriovorax sp.]